MKGKGIRMLGLKIRTSKRVEGDRLWCVSFELAGRSIEIEMLKEAFPALEKARKGVTDIARETWKRIISSRTETRKQTDVAAGPITGKKGKARAATAPEKLEREMTV